MLLIVFNYDGVYCVYVWRPSAGVLIGSVILQVFALLRREGIREEYRYWLNDLRPRLCFRPKECRCTAQHDTRPTCAAAPCCQPPPQEFAVGLALQLQPNVMVAESNTPGNRLNP